MEEVQWGGKELLLDGELSALAIEAHCFVHSAISATADEANDFVAVKDVDLACVAVRRGFLDGRRFYGERIQIREKGRCIFDGLGEGIDVI